MFLKRVKHHLLDKMDVRYKQIHYNCYYYYSTILLKIILSCLNYNCDYSLITQTLIFHCQNPHSYKYRRFSTISITNDTHLIKY